MKNRLLLFIRNHRIKTNSTQFSLNKPHFEIARFEWILLNREIVTSTLCVSKKIIVCEKKKRITSSRKRANTKKAHVKREEKQEYARLFFHRKEKKKKQGQEYNVSEKSVVVQSS